VAQGVHGGDIEIVLGDDAFVEAEAVAAAEAHGAVVGVASEWLPSLPGCGFCGRLPVVSLVPRSTDRVQALMPLASRRQRFR